MSIKRKALTVTASLGLILLLVTLGVLNLAVFPAFQDLEQQLSRENLTRVELVIESEIQELKNISTDWSSWDSTHQYVLDRNDDFRRSTLVESALTSIHVNVMGIISTDGEVVWNEAVDLDTGTSLDFSEVFLQPLSSDSAILSHDSVDSNFAGILMTRSAPMLFTSYPILTNDGEGPIVGTFVMGRLLGPVKLEQISLRTDVKFGLFAIGRDQLTPGGQRAVEKLLLSAETIFFDDQNEYLRSYRILDDIHGSPAFLLEVHTPHRVTHVGAAAIQAALVLIFVAIFMLMSFAWIFLSRSILDPVLRLTSHMGDIRKTGDLSKVIGLQRDDEIGKLGEELNELTNQLDVTRTELEKSRDSAIEGSAAKSEFLATMSHEIRTPMNGVLGMTELLLSSGLDKRQRHLALSAHRSADGLLSVINDILDISKIEADMLEIDLLDFDLLEVCEDAVEMVAESAQRKGLEIVSDFARDTPTLVGDPTRIRQVLVNLLSNAIKFTDEGEVRLGQRFVHREDDTLEVLFEVVDTGIGIAADLLATIFDPFTQLDGSIKRSYSGTGLGLTISSRLVAIMNGELAVESEVGRGSCFRFNIALRISTHQAPPSVDNEILKGIRALVVGDRDVNHEILQGQLVSWGVRADSARDGMEAIALLEEAAVEGDPYRIGLFDWEMSEMDGIELAGRVKTDQRIPDLPIMILSSTFVAIDSQISQNIVNCFLTKPVRRQQLLNSLRGVLGGVNSPAPDSTVNTLKNRLGGRVLLAEDSRVNQEVAGAALEVAGCEVTIAENGVDALRAASEGFDLILMDCHMPEMDGFEATRRIRSLETESRLPRVPIIALTADVRKGIEEECESAGMDGYLSKPFSQKDLAAVLAEWLPVVSIEPTDSPAELQLENLRYFDVTAVQQLFDLSKKQGKNILRLVVQQYRDQFPGLLDVAREALENERRDQCADASHSLRSLAANVGATKIAELCAEVEREARAGSSSGLGGMFGDMEVAFAESQAELTILLSIGTGTETGTAAAVDETPQRILIADDDPSVVLAVGESLRGAGYEVA
ncbi:MAG: response regulator, partial [Gammaproteobacteria bacterium]|nr:response regulator [Gammaproteobacteria bacterium]